MCGRKISFRHISNPQLSEAYLDKVKLDIEEHLLYLKNGLKANDSELKNKLILSLIEEINSLRKQILLIKGGY